ncbi:MAG TPA: YHS domain-containing protein [Candidatus Limnocylindrales bacterium]|nr:YHS domain-containing protein [Candidatus Limnocylindrales bacterium]
MSGTHPERVIDPVCGMRVDVDAAEADGLTHTHDGRTYAFCRQGCLDSFRAEPARYAAKAEAAALATASVPAGSALPVIDEGMRRWYESCACCLSDAFPEVKAALDAERAAAGRPGVDPGICEVAEAEAAEPVPTH